MTIPRIPRCWATTLPVIGVTAYVGLMTMSQPKKVAGFDIDRFSVSVSERIAIALNSPAMLYGWQMESIVDNPQWWVKWCFGVVPTFVVWYLIGLWLDRFDMPVRSKSASSWCSPTRLIATGLLIIVLLWVGLMWSTVYASHPFPSFPFDLILDVVVALVIWPVFVCVIAIRTIIRGVY